MTTPIVIPDDIDDESMEPSSLPSVSIISSLHSFQQVSQFHESALKRDRERDGRCAECGVHTHRFRMDHFHEITLKVPLTIENEVHRGRCLLCFPFRTRETTTPCQPPSLSQEILQSSTSLTAFPDTRLVPSFPTESSLSPGLVASDLGEEFDSTDIVDTLYTMRWRVRSERVQEWGCEQLWVHSWDDETSVAIGRIGGIHRILDAMSHFPQNSHLQRCGCEALQNLALNSYNRSTIVDYGGAALIVQAMMRHFDFLDIQQCGCVALASLATSPELHDDIMRAGGGHAIIHVARRYSGNENIRRGAFHALQTLGVDPHRYVPGSVPTSDEYLVHHDR